MGQSVLIFLIAYMSLVASNIIVIDESASNKEYNCNPSESCTIGCLFSGSCAGATLYCPSNHGCTVICDGRTNTAVNTCFNTTIYAQHSEHLSIAVTAHQSNAELMTVYAPELFNKQSTLTCNSGATNLNQCKDINIYTRTGGFKDIKLKCNDSTNQCHISGRMQCTNVEYESNRECTIFEYKNSLNIYQCSDQNFCLNPHSSSLSPTVTVSSSIDSIDTLNQNGMRVKGANEVIIKDDKGSEDIHDFVVVVVGTIIICCVILVLLALCGVLFVRFNRDNVERTLIKQYLSGRGSSLSMIFTRSKDDNLDSNETSNETSNVSNTFDNNTLTDVQNPNSVPQSTTHYHEMEHNHTPHTTNSNEMRLAHASQSDIDIGNSLDFNLFDHENDVNLENPIFEDINNANPLFHKHPRNVSLSISGDSVTQSVSVSVSDANSIDLSENEMDNNTVSDMPMHKRCFSEPPSHVLTERQRKIHEEYIANRAKCYGYSQPNILYEEEENYTSETTTERSKSGNNIAIEEDKGNESNASSDSDDLLAEGGTVNMAVPIQVNTADMKDPEILSDDGSYPNLPPNAFIQYSDKLNANGVAFQL